MSYNQLQITFVIVIQGHVPWTLLLDGIAVKLVRKMPVQHAYMLYKIILHIFIIYYQDII